MKILVTGGNGFIGTHVVEKIKSAGHHALIFDRNRSSKNDIFLGDVRDYTSVTEAVAIADGVIHLAGILGTQETIDEPMPSIETNIIGSLNIFKSCLRYQKKCVYISVGNYWMNNSYSITKNTVERLAFMYNKEHGTKIAVVRGLNAYGEGQKDKPVRKIIPNFVIPALKGEAIKIYGDGNQIMDMIYVGDLADILVKALTEEHNQYSKVFEAGTGRKTTVNEIAQEVIKQTGKGKIEYLPMRPGEPENSIVIGNPETLRPLYGGNIPDMIPLAAGITRTIEYYKSKI
jgi:UDP-glucose 4-epimerase